MTLSTGTKLSHYEITSQIGKGGMGEVYQAKDQKLGRDVAIKVLPEEFAKDADRVGRFQREAKLLASLNHPNIAAIHGLEESDDTHFLVMELIEGQTLDARIKAGSISVEEALKWALQIAEALEAAHEKGVIHRDLKPANIKVTPEGKVKVLDFGLAKAFAGEQADLNLSNSPTLSHAATMQGVILGTAAYMSPEQAKGKTVDKRTDIWAFGAVLFEILTGKAAFQGDEVSEILASVIKGDTNLDLLPSNIHQRIHEVISRCLQKDLRKRYPDIANVRYEIERVLEDPGGVFVKQAAAEPRTRARSIIPWAIAVLGIVIVAMAVWYLKPVAPPGPVIRSYYEVPISQKFLRAGETLVAISSDGTRIVYVSNGQLYLRELKDLDAMPIQGTDEDLASPFFSPDGQWVGYYSFLDKQWKKISVGGGTPMKLCEAPSPNGVVWTDNKTILFGSLDGRSIKQVSEEGGTAESVIEAKESEGVYGPQILPGGEWVLFTTTSSDTGLMNWDKAKIAVKSLKTDERKILPIIGSDARYVPTGHIVYAQGNVLYASVFDIENMEVTGNQFPVVKPIMRATQNVTGTANYGFSDTGTLVYVAGNKGSANFPNATIVSVDREGKEEPLIPEPKLYINFKISPDGKKVALAEMDETSERSHIQIWDVDRKRSQIITSGDSFDDSPVWTDSENIVFRSSRNDREGIYLKAASGAGRAEFVGSMPNTLVARPFCVLKDPKTIFVASVFSAASRIAILPMEGKKECVLLLDGFDPTISPDGQWLAYSSYDESGVRQIYVIPYPDTEGGLWQISIKGGDQPLWSPDPDRRELYYRSGNEVISVEYEETGSAFIQGSSETLFTRNYIHNGPNQWGISPDGKRFLMMKQELTGVSDYTINIVLNWFEELTEKVPVP